MLVLLQVIVISQAKTGGGILGTLKAVGPVFMQPDVATRLRDQAVGGVSFGDLYDYGDFPY